jgi:hypothetical protein
MATQIITPAPQHNAVAVLQFPSESPKITQEEIVQALLLKQHIGEQQAELDKIEADIRARLEANAPVESGLHTAQLKEHFRISIAWKQIAERLAGKLYGEGRGEAYLKNVAGNTKPNRTVSLDLT